MFWRLSKYLLKLNQIINGIVCHLNATIEQGLFIPHIKNIVIGAGVKIGRNVMLLIEVTLGAREWQR